MAYEHVTEYSMSFAINLKIIMKLFKFNKIC